MASLYSFYTGSFKGSLIPQTDFDHYAQKASAYIDMITRGRTTDSDLECVKMAICAAADCCYANEDICPKKSESVGDYSVSYADNVSQGLTASLRRAILPYLLPTGMMSRSC